MCCLPCFLQLASMASRTPGEKYNPCCSLGRWPRLPLEASSPLDFGATPVNESKVGQVAVAA